MPSDCACIPLSLCFVFLKRVLIWINAAGSLIGCRGGVWAVFWAVFVFGRGVMPGLELVLASPANGLMQRLIAEWDGQLRARRAPKEILDAVRRYEGVLVPDGAYGVYVLCCRDGEGHGQAPYEALVHVNHAHPGSTKPVLRLTWSRLAPRYEWVRDPVEQHSRIFSSLVYGAIGLALGPLKSLEIKMYLFNRADQAFGRRFAAGLTAAALPFTLRVRGNWLHFTLRDG